MAEYTDTILLNCSRKSGVEARSGNNSQNAIWTNQLGQAIRLDVGDKVEMESVFINNVGSANAQTIEFSGKQKSGLNAINNIPKYTVTQKLESFDFQSVTYDARYRLGKYRKLSTTEVADESIPIQDNIAPLIYGYYITSNEYPLYISQPRNYAFPYIRDQIPDNDTRRALFRGTDDDSRGASRFPLNLNMYVFDDYHDVYITRLRVDNSRFTQIGRAHV